MGSKDTVEDRLIKFNNHLKSVKRRVDFSEVDAAVEAATFGDETPGSMLRYADYSVSEIWQSLQAGEMTYDFIKEMRSAHWDAWHLNFEGVLRNMEKAGFGNSNEYETIEDLADSWYDLLEAIVEYSKLNR